MRLRYHELVGKRIVTSDGKNVGRVHDLTANAEGGKLFVTGLLVGPSAMLRRIAFRIPVRRIPWEAVASVNDQIHLKVDEAEFRQTPHEYD